MPQDVTVHYTGRFLEMVSVRTPEGSDWEYVRRTNCERAVVIFGLTPDGQVPLVRQVRPAVRAPVWELPAGLLDVPDENLEAAARRELVEEAGYQAQRIVPLFSVPANAAASSLFLDCVLATGLRFVGRSGGDEAHPLEVHLFPAQALSRDLYRRVQTGEFVDPRIWSVIKVLEDHFPQYWPVKP